MLELHVWGPAFGLPSIDAECLATIAYFTQTINTTEYQLIQTSPSAVPTHHLPALHLPSSNTWISGYSAITAHLKSTSSQQQPPSTITNDSTAYTTFLQSHAPPLLSLSLYVSSANWSSTTRPAYSRILPFPLPWTEPPAIRAAMSARAAHLGMSALDTDAEAEKAEARAAAEAGAGWVHVPESIRKRVGRGGMGGVREALSPEERARIRLEGIAGDVLDVVGEVFDGEGGWEEGTTVELRCLAFGYLALMLLPEVPRPWLREVLRRRYGGLCEYVEGFGARCGLLAEEGGWGKLPWARTESGSLAVVNRDNNSVAGIAVRFAQGLIKDIPLVGEEWARWWAHWRVKGVRTSSKREVKSVGNKNMELILLAGSGLAFVSAIAGLFYLYRGMYPFGARVQTWRAPISLGLGGLGAAGAMFSGLALD